MPTRWFLLLVALLLSGASVVAQSGTPPVAPPAPVSPEYRALQSRLARGWNTWDTQSVTTQVLLPDALAIRLVLRHNTALNSDAVLQDALIGRRDPGAETVVPGPHSWDGSYTSLHLTWRGSSLRVQSAHDGDDLVLLVTPDPTPKKSTVPATVVFEAGYLWNRPGSVTLAGDHMEAVSPVRNVPIYFTGPHQTKPDSPPANMSLYGHYFSASLTQPVGLSTGHHRTLDQIRAALDREEKAYRNSIAQPAASATVQDEIQTTLGWDTIYDPENNRVISPVSRIWSVNWGGYVLFDWDTFFAASLAAIGDRDLAYANAMEILREETPAGFVPNYARSGNWKSTDRSEPPVGAITVLNLYSHFHDRWLLADTFEPLLRWNRWWAAHRDVDGYLVWGSDPLAEPIDPDDAWRGTREGAILESGLDNSPMYDNAPFDSATHRLLIGDVGLMSLYIADCDALAEIADTLGKAPEAKELRTRAGSYRAKLATMWDDRSGIFLNRNLKTGEPSPRLSPTNFYPLLARAATPEQANRMIQEHLLNPNEFWGKWVIPSIARNDPAFKDQNYWRGRIWGPMNYLVYLGLRNYDVPQVQRGLAQKSLALVQQEWSAKGHLHENYNAITGDGDDVTNSDAFYHWGALLGLIGWTEDVSPPHPAH
ncbi:MAG TPA: trehalase family glycosidase [Acidobacteriaceae bacterium]